MPYGACGSLKYATATKINREGFPHFIHHGTQLLSLSVILSIATVLILVSLLLFFLDLSISS